MQGCEREQTCPTACTQGVDSRLTHGTSHLAPRADEQAREHADAEADEDEEDSCRVGHVAVAAVASGGRRRVGRRCRHRGGCCLPVLGPVLVPRLWAQRRCCISQRPPPPVRAAGAAPAAATAPLLAVAAGPVLLLQLPVRLPNWNDACRREQERANEARPAACAVTRAARDWLWQQCCPLCYARDSTMPTPRERICTSLQLKSPAAVQDSSS